eukprot:1139285-Pelagomonas_calceolata.AAC.3
MDIGSTDRLVLQNLQIPENSTNRNFPTCTPVFSLVVSLEGKLQTRVPRTDSQYLSRSRGRCGGNRELSTPATATPPASRVRHPSQLLPE